MTEIMKTDYKKINIGLPISKLRLVCYYDQKPNEPAKIWKISSFYHVFGYELYIVRWRTEITPRDDVKHRKDIG